MKRAALTVALMSLALLSACSKKKTEEPAETTAQAAEVVTENIPASSQGTVKTSVSTGNRRFVPSSFANREDASESAGHIKIKTGVQKKDAPALKDEWFEVKQDGNILYMKITSVKMKGAEQGLEKFNENIPEKEQIKVVPEEQRDTTRNIMFEFEYYYPSSRNKGTSKDVIGPDVLVFSDGNSKTKSFLAKAKMNTGKKTVKMDKILKGVCFSTSDIYEDGLETKVTVGVQYDKEYTYAKLQ